MSDRTKEELESENEAIHNKLNDFEKRLRSSEYANKRYEDTIEQVTEEYTNSSEEYFYYLCVSELNNRMRSLTSEIMMSYPSENWKNFLMDSHEQKQLFNKIIESYENFVQFSVENVPQIITCYYNPYCNPDNGDDNRINTPPLQNEGIYSNFANVAVRLVYKNIFLSLYNMLNQDDRDIVRQDEHKSSTINFIKKLFGKLCVKTIDVFLDSECVDDSFFNLALMDIKTKKFRNNDQEKNYDYKKSLEGVFEKQINFLITQCLFDDTIKEDFYKIMLTYFNPHSNYYVENLLEQLSTVNFQNQLKLYMSANSMNSGFKPNINNTLFLNNIGNTTFHQLYNMGTETQETLQNNLDNGFYCLTKIKICHTIIDLKHSDIENDLLNKAQMEYRLFDCSSINHYEDYYIKIHDFYDEYKKLFNRLQIVNSRDLILKTKSNNESATELFTYAFDKFRYCIRQETSEMFFENIYNFVFKCFYYILYTSKMKLVHHAICMRELFAALRVVTDNNKTPYQFNMSEKRLLLFISDLNYDMYQDSNSFSDIVYKDIVRIANDTLNNEFDKEITIFTDREREESDIKTVNDKFEHYTKLIELFSSTFESYDSNDLKPLFNTTKKLKLYY